MIGIIPARAGFTGCPVQCVLCRWDHPRSRGVYGRLKNIHDARKGSSPLARGLHVHVIRPLIPVRIIPARAGFTDLLCSEMAFAADHPRSRGVYLRTAHRVCRFAGSSPLARGLPAPPHGAAPHSPDHPRSRGVYDGGRGLLALRQGSSPLARGLPAQKIFTYVPDGIIPARAGFTSGAPY